MRFPSPEDFTLFSAWDGYMLASYCVVISAMSIIVPKILKVDPNSSDGSKCRRLANGTKRTAFVFGIVSYLWLPSRGVGSWGVVIIALIIITYVNAIYRIFKGKSLF